MAKCVLFVTVLAVCLASCERNIGVDGTDINSKYYEDETDYEWDPGTVTQIVFDGESVDIEGTGATYSGRLVTISVGGEFLVSGTWNNGQILVNAPAERVKLILDNVSISNDEDAVINIESCGKVCIILKDGSVNTINDGDIRLSGGLNGAISSTADIVFSGSGKLVVNGNYKDAVAGKNGVIVHCGDYEITAADDGIRGKDFIVIQDGSFNVKSGGDAFVSDNEDSGYGYIDVQAGNITIESYGDGFQAENNLTVAGGNFDIVCEGSQSSGKGFKAGLNMEISGGDFIIESNDDAVHSDYDIHISSGDFTITTGDDAFHAENSLTVDYADINIKKCYEGLEAKTVTIAGGNIILVASDDGLNAASGVSSYGGFPGQSSGNNNLYVKGGYIVVSAAGDGIDINGSVNMSGGTLIIHGPTSSNNGALDYDGSFTISGGTLIAAGSSGMAQAPGSSSSQCSVMIRFSTTLLANTLVNLRDEDGNEVATFAPKKKFQSLVVSSPLLNKGTAYKLYTGGTSEYIDENGIADGSTYTPGTFYKSFTISSIITTIGQTTYW